jgi:hypothetical protein
MLLVAPTGVGKTTLALQIVLGLTGVTEEPLLGSRSGRGVRGCRFSICSGYRRLPKPLGDFASRRSVAIWPSLPYPQVSYFK